MSPARHRARIRSIAAGAALTLAGALLLSACAADLPGVATTSSGSRPTRVTQDPDLAGNIHVAYELSTHCGIRELKFAGQWYARDGGLLDDGNGNPPKGWGNPEQNGRLAVSGKVAVFTDSAGHRETFHLRPGTEASVMCS
jgi:hypothetical protein